MKYKKMENVVDSRHDIVPKVSNHSEVNNEPVSWMKKIRAIIACVTIEPYLICYFLPFHISYISVQDLKLEKACRVHLKYAEEKCSDDKVTSVTQSMVDEMTIWQEHVEHFIPAITILFIAAWSDRTGNRKALMLVPMLGELISHIGLFLTTYFFEEWSLFVTGLIEVLPTALSGGYYVGIMGSFCHLADVTSLETRTFRIGIAAAVMNLCIPTAIYVREKLETAGYYGTFGLVISLYVLGLLYTYFRIDDVKSIKIEATWQRKLLNFFDPSYAWRTVSIACKSGPYRKKILLLVAAFVVISGPVTGEEQVLYSYLRHKDQMNNAEIRIFYDYLLLVGVCGILITVILFSKYLKIHDAILGIMATTSIIMSSCMYALAPSTRWFYCGPILDFIGGSWKAVIWSLWTKIVAPEHIAKVYPLFSVAESIILLIYGPMFIMIFYNTKEWFPGTIYFLAAAMAAPAILIFIFIYKEAKKEERYKVTEPEPQSNELYAYDNFVTSL